MASVDGPCPLLFVLWEEEEEEEEASTSSSCADTTLWARVPLSLFVVWCAVFPSFVDRPECSASWPLWTRRTVLRFFRLRHVQGWFYWLFCTSRCFAFLVGSPPLGLHHGRYGSPGGVVPVVCNNRCLWSRSRFFCAVAAHQQGRLHHCDDAQIMQFIVEVILLVLVGCPALEHGY